MTRRMRHTTQGTKQYMARQNLKGQVGARAHKDIWGNPVKCNAKV